MQHIFNIQDAVDYGIEEAIILYNIRFWLDKNLANNSNIHDGEVWTYNSVKAWAKLFPYMSESKISKTLTKMEEKGLIISGNYNKAKYDRTKWYSIPQYGKVHFAKMPNGFRQSDEPIPDVNTNVSKDITTDTSEQSSQEIPEIIKAFESINPACSRYYGNKTQREACQKLIDIHTFERVIKIIQTVLPKSNGLAYVPTITTPLQLLEKYSALESAIKRSQSNYKKENPQFTIVNGVPIKM